MDKFQIYNNLSLFLILVSVFIVLIVRTYRVVVYLKIFIILPLDFVFLFI